MKKIGVVVMVSLFGMFGNPAAALEEGKPAPLVVAKDQSGVVHKLSDYQGQWVLLYFYPKDDTPGCTRQACRIRDRYRDFQKAGIVVFGVSRQDAGSHEAFKKKHRLPFDLLVDEDGKIGEAFGISTYPIVGMYKRQSVLIGPDQTIVRFMEDVDPETHDEEILKTVQAHSAAKKSPEKKPSSGQSK